MKNRALSKRLNKKDNILHIQILFDKNEEVYYTFNVYDSSNNQKLGDIITTEEVDEMIEAWIGRLKINKTFYEKAL